MVIDLQTLSGAMDGTAAAIRCVTDYQPEPVNDFETPAIAIY